MKKHFKTSIYMYTKFQRNCYKERMRKLETLWFCLANSLSECNWTESFQNLSEWDKRQFESYQKQNNRLQTVEKEKKKYLNKKIHISMHFYEVFFLHILPYSTSAISFRCCFFLLLQVWANKVNRDLCLKMGSMHGSK